MKILNLLLAFNVLIASTGISLHVHTCNASNVTVINLTEKGCKSVMEGEVDCCAAKSKCSSKSEEDGCCTDEQQYYKGDLLGTAAGNDKIALPTAFATPVRVFHQTWSGGHAEPQTNTGIDLPPGAYQSPPSVLLQVFRC